MTAETKGNLSRVGRWTWRHLHQIAAVPFLALAFYLIILDRIAGATLSAAIFLVLVLVRDLESLKAFGLVEAKLRKADELVEKLSAVARVTAEHTYLQLGRGSRIGGIPIARKQKLADAIDEVMNAAGATAKEIERLKRDYLTFALYDLYEGFADLLRENAQTNAHKYATRASDSSPAEADELRRKAELLRKVEGSHHILTDLESLGFRVMCHKDIPDDLLPEGDAKKLHGLADHLTQIADEVMSKGRVTDRAVALLDDPDDFFEKRKRRYRELFGEDSMH